MIEKISVQCWSPKIFRHRKKFLKKYHSPFYGAKDEILGLPTALENPRFEIIGDG